MIKKSIKLTLTFCIIAFANWLMPMHAHAAELTNQFTITTWIKGTTSVATKAIVVKNNEVRMVTDGSGNPLCQINNGSWQTAATSSTAIAVGTWAHVACTYDKTTLKVFVNGIQTGSQALSVALQDTANVFKMGQDDGATYGDLAGTIDDVKIYNYARTQSQIIEDMNGGHPLVGKDASMAAYYKFDEGYGTSASNSVGSSYTGTLAGTALPTWSNSGKFGKGLFFTAATTSGGSRVTSSTPINLGTTTGDQLTFSMWINPSTTQTNAIPVFIRNGTGSDANYYAYLTTPSGGSYKLAVGWYNGSGFTGVFSTTQIIQSGTWSHLAVVITQGTNIKYYVNGILKNTLSWGGGANSVAATTSFNIGSHTGTTAQSFDGYIDEVKVYQTGLTDDQILLDYNQGKTAILGSTSTTSASANVGDSSSAREYCVPGDTSTCTAPVAEYKLDENTGTTANDTSGNANTGTLTNGPIWVAGKMGSAVKFDGSNDYISVADSSSLAFGTGSWTISGWIKYSNTTNHGYIYSKRSGTTDNDMYLRQTTGAVWCELGDGTITSWNGSTNVADNNWHYVVCQANRTTNRGYVYLDGKLDNSGTDISARSGSSTTATNPTIGRYSLASSQLFIGTLDQVRIYNYARTPAQIAWEYNKGAPVAWYKFDECQGTTIYNSAPTASGAAAGNNGTLTIGATGTNTSAGTCVGASTEAWKNGVTGKINSSMSFDGTDDYVNVGDPSNGSLDFGTGNFSISGWLKKSSSAATTTIISKIDGAASSNTGYAVFFNFNTSDGILFSRITAGTTTVASSADGTNIADNTWHFWTVIFNRSGNMTRYVDGNIYGSQNSITTVSGSVSNSLNFQIGARSKVTPDLYFSGQIDDIRVYNYALTAQQVKSIYSNGAVSFK